MTNILYFDIETSPCLSWVWGCGKQRVGPNQILEPTRIICISYKFSKDKKVTKLKWDSSQCDKAMLTRFASVLEKADVILGHNGKNFDVKHVNTRMAFHGLDPKPMTMIEDTLHQVRAAFRLPSNTLNYVAQYFGLGEKLKTGGIDLWLDVWLKNDRKALKLMSDYCDQDVLLLQEVHERILPYVKSKITNTVDADTPTCPNHECNSTDLQKRGTYKSSPLRTVQRYRCNVCCGWSLGGQNLLKKVSKQLR